MKLLILLFSIATFGQVKTDTIIGGLSGNMGKDYKELLSGEEYILIDPKYLITPHESSMKRFDFENYIFQNNIIQVRDKKYLVRELKEGGWLITPLEQIDYELTIDFEN